MNTCTINVSSPSLKIGTASETRASGQPSGWTCVTGRRFNTPAAGLPASPSGLMFGLEASSVSYMVLFFFIDQMR